MSRTTLKVANFNIMDHQSTKFSRLGKIENRIEYMARYRRVIEEIERALFTDNFAILCLEEATDDFLRLLWQNQRIMNNYYVYQYRSGRFQLATLVKNDLFPGFIDLTYHYQSYYENYHPRNQGKPSRTQIFYLELSTGESFLLIHSHFTGVPSEQGGTKFRQGSWEITQAYLREYQGYNLAGGIVKRPDLFLIHLGDFNDDQPSDFITANRSKILQDSRKTSFHRFIRLDAHSFKPTGDDSCEVYFQDKKDFQPLWEKLDHLHYDSWLAVDRVHLAPYGGLDQKEVPYLANVEPKNLMMAKRLQLCNKPTIKENLQLVINPSQVTFNSTSNQWPSDHALIGYTLSVIPYQNRPRPE